MNTITKRSQVSVEKIEIIMDCIRDELILKRLEEKGNFELMFSCRRLRNILRKYRKSLGNES